MMECWKEDEHERIEGIKGGRQERAVEYTHRNLRPLIGLDLEGQVGDGILEEKGSSMRLDWN